MTIQSHVTKTPHFMHGRYVVGIASNTHMASNMPEYTTLLAMYIHMVGDVLYIYTID